MYPLLLISREPPQLVGAPEIEIPVSTRVAVPVGSVAAVAKTVTFPLTVVPEDGDVIVMVGAASACAIGVAETQIPVSAIQRTVRRLRWRIGSPIYLLYIALN